MREREKKREVGGRYTHPPENDRCAVRRAAPLRAMILPTPSRRRTPTLDGERAPVPARCIPRADAERQDGVQSHLPAPGSLEGGQARGMVGGFMGTPLRGR